jgi:hypothetical protein
MLTDNILYSTGKRYNILHNRTDPWDYDVDQLLFGTILFTLVAFLFPTVLAYYVLFAMVSGNPTTYEEHYTTSPRRLDATLRYMALREYGNIAGLYESFPSIRTGTSSERSMAATWFDSRPRSLKKLVVTG